MSRAAVRYAKAILELAKEQNNADAVFVEMQRIKDTVKGSDDLKDLLNTPLIKSDVKRSALKAVFVNSSAITEGLFDTLVNNKRIKILSNVAEIFIALYKQDKGFQVAIVTTAVPLNADFKAVILAKVKELTGKETDLESVVDESIIGGFILRVGDLQYNASVASQLANLKRTFEDNSYVSQI